MHSGQFDVLSIDLCVVPRKLLRMSFRFIYFSTTIGNDYKINEKCFIEIQMFALMISRLQLISQIAVRVNCLVTNCPMPPFPLAPKKLALEITSKEFFVLKIKLIFVSSLTLLY